ncbi:unnamed protein product [Acanthoscelides obtectus]|uniref:Uncharacterized protein n=1 Tax=Acanthoscelides obtectus TaxID=200917 RepID=A0A9P0PC48_ACAOB|nr:unnamed protein product [Acanthoscelides obtectus]CAK1655140.1 hypothetical protein AOBTE_LOCUS19044 [Acanthoscelides obtectus]
MSSRTKLIMKLSNQQASHSCVDIVEYEVEKDGILSPIHAQPSSKINETLVNSNEVPAPKISTSFDHIEFPVDLNDSASINNDNSTSFNHLEVPTGLNDASISIDFDHFDSQTDLNDAISMNNELDNPEILGTEQDEYNTNNTITNTSSEHDDGAADDLDVSYVPEENDSDSSNSANEDNSNYHEERNDPDTSLPTKRTRRKRKLSESWNYNINKYKRLRGQPYQGKKEITGTWNYNINKPGKFLENPCNCSLSRKKSAIQCQKMTEENRLKIFQKFWNTMTWNERKLQVQALVNCDNVKRRRGELEVSKRKYSMKYFLQVDLEKIRVCKRMFGSTLGLKETLILSWIKEFNSEPDDHQRSRKSETRRAKFAEKNTAVYQFLQSLPKMESHYCRSSSKKLYLEPLWRSNAALYNFFKREYCGERNLEPPSIATFMKIFEELNLSLYIPKKDLCDVCEAYKTKNLSEDKYNLHQTLKLEARQEKEKDKSTSDATVNVYAMDLQSVLLAPKSTVAAMYYKTKLVVHNFTIYNLKSKEGFCRVAGDPVVTDIKALRYLPNSEIQFKMRHTDAWCTLNQRINKKMAPCKFDDLPSLYTERRKIKKEKYEHLQILKSGLLQDYHQFYEELPYE